MKRILLALMAAVMLLSFVGCTDNTGDATSSKKKPTSSISASSDKESSVDASSNGGSAASSQEQPKGGIELTTLDGSPFLLVPDKISEYLGEAEKYDVTDFSSSIADKYIEYQFSAVPVTLEWKYTDGYSPKTVKVLVSSLSDMKNATEYAVGNADTKVDIYNLYTGADYYWCVKATSDKGDATSDVQNFKTVKGPRIMNISGTHTGNCRDIGSWTDKNGNAMKQGLAYRGRTIDRLDEAGIATCKSLGIKTILDLRTPADSAKSYPNGVSLLGNNVKIINIRTQSYYDFLSDKNSLKNFSVFADWSNYPIYFHCAAGADRTGTISYMIQAICNVDERQMLMDYELSDRLRTYSNFPKFAKAIASAEGATIRDKACNVLLSKGITHMELSNIYNIYMTDSAVFDSGSLAAGKISGNTTSFDLALRSSGGVASVKVGGADVGWSMKGNTLVVNSATKGAIGVITFKDGATLNFSI